MRVWLGIAGVAFLTVLAAGCGGGSKPPGVASLGTTGSNTTTNTPPAGQSDSGTGGRPSRTDFIKFANCMDTHGVNVQVGQGGQGVSINGGDPGSPTFKAAQKACGKYLPNGGAPPTLTPAERAANMKRLLTMAQCLRKHGFPNFPDPTGQGVFQLGSGSGLTPNNPQFRAAMQSCRPGKGTLIQIAVGAPGPSGGKTGVGG